MSQIKLRLVGMLDDSCTALSEQQLHWVFDDADKYELANIKELIPKLPDSEKAALVDEIINKLLKPQKWEYPEYVDLTMEYLKTSIHYSDGELNREKNRLIAQAFAKEFGEGDRGIYKNKDFKCYNLNKPDIGTVCFSKEAAVKFAEHLDNKLIEGWVYE